MKLKTEFEFDAAHRLVGHKGLCKNLHGHRWVVVIEVEKDNRELELDEVGMLWDFGNAKKIEKLFDHKTILKNCKENKPLINILKTEEIYLMNENPTAENLAWEIINILSNDNPRLSYRVIIYESPKSFAEVKL